MSVHLRESLFASPKPDLTLEDCDFYHTVEIPGHGVMHGEWDLRNRVDAYLGNFPFSGKRVLEIGPASGFLTFEMEKRGADVVCLEVPDEPGWDFVPYPPKRLAVILSERAEHMRKVKNSYWFMHRLHEFTRQAMLLRLVSLAAGTGTLRRSRHRVRASALRSTGEGPRRMCRSRRYSYHHGTLSSGHRRQPGLSPRPRCRWF